MGEVIAIPDFDEITDAAFPDSNTSLQIFPLKREPPIVIGLVSCDRIGEYKSAFLATTMIKSVLVSAEIYGVSQVEFHIFIEADTSGYFMSRLQDFGYAKKDRKNRVHVRVNFHPILDAIPENFQKEFLYSRKNAHWRGGFARLLYATNLPAVDSIIHLDTDIIITGDITQLWSFLGKMDDGHMLAVAPAAEPDEKFFDKLYQYHFADIPHVKPWGLNTGVLVMNLTRMRRDGWEKIVFDTYDYYSKRFDLRNSDGRIMNIILANHRDIFIFLTCQFNYEYIHCDNGQNCKHALEDPNGIQLVHGAGFQFQKKRASLHKVFEFFEQYDMATKMSGRA
ncbi:Glucoside xylosyltransferase 1 [Orchesella cincta]|uniref:UDP-D-xylose:beta-D-glucoside alpha-1,3-D-xylosyltransferase n=1 Tax=Orchesella cincta TaxID=48709 RepID=A0A1D2M2U8_ORCCI|nr:Glucoside xylosyltransferase 1 [Orchesella cincta]